MYLLYGVVLGENLIEGVYIQYIFIEYRCNIEGKNSSLFGVDLYPIIPDVYPHHLNGVKVYPTGAVLLHTPIGTLKQFGSTFAKPNHVTVPSHIRNTDRKLQVTSQQDATNQATRAYKGGNCVT